jgi:hypothetical protein
MACPWFLERTRRGHVDDGDLFGLLGLGAIGIKGRFAAYPFFIFIFISLFFDGLFDCDLHWDGDISGGFFVLTWDQRGFRSTCISFPSCQ